MKKKIQYKNAALTYHVYGKGFPVILLHGFAETNAIWKNQTKYLSKYCKLIVPDLPGSGESVLPVLNQNLSITDLADAVHTIIVNENIEQSVMLGHSMGGYITLAFAEKYASLLKAFGFVHSTAFADSEEKKANRLKGINTMELYGTQPFLKTSIPGLFSDQFKKDHTDIINQLVEEGKQFKKHNLQQYYYAMMNRSDKTSILQNSKIPVLFVIGTEDIAAPLNDVLKQVHLPEIAYIHIIENAGHMSMLEMPRRLNFIIRSFVNACE